MNPTLFLLVDAVLYTRLESAMRAAISPETDGDKQRAFNAAAESWSWWRSLWGVL